ncbi:MAG: hypothetical protein IPI30_06630 [Saprospiraceae bacterium]|nr:hypothetical protein [Candidatus Vicinibacter affinis]
MHTGWNGQTYNTGGICSYKTKNSFGCDSTVALELTLNHSDSNRVQIETLTFICLEWKNLYPEWCVHTGHKSIPGYVTV